MVMQMKKLLSLFAAVVLTVLCAQSCKVSAIGVSAEAAVLLCADTGEVLFAQNAYTHRSMASTTKIMTALLTLEENTPNREITTTAEMVRVEGTSMGLLPGDRVTLYALACGMLLSSGNDAANTAAVALAGSVDRFAARMNARAAEIGMCDTHFVTPSGLDDEAHYSTAYDMALLAREALGNPVFRSICQSRSLRVSYGNPPYLRTLTNHNRLLRMVDGCIGVKTGFTKKSGRCLVSAVERDGVTLIAVTLNAPDDWNDHITLFDFGFSRVKSAAADTDLHGMAVPVVGGTRRAVSVRVAGNPCIVSRTDGKSVSRQIYLRPFVYAPVQQGDILGTAVYRQNGETVCAADIVAAADVPYLEAAPHKTEQKQSIVQKLKGVLKSWHNRFVCKNTSPNAVLLPVEKRKK